jgi:uncharacterized protein (DUF983 family)
MASPTLTAALLQGKCPRCRRGDVFKYPITKLSKFNDMNEFCPVCGLRLEPEPGFYQGAMYVSYGFTVLMMIVISIILSLAGDFSEWVYVWTVIAVMLILVPLNYRMSRVFYLHFIGGIKYDPNLSQ